jgi:hypothetical protein
MTYPTAPQKITSEKAIADQIGNTDLFITTPPVRRSMSVIQSPISRNGFHSTPQNFDQRLLQIWRKPAARRWRSGYSLRRENEKPRSRSSGAVL